MVCCITIKAHLGLLEVRYDHILCGNAVTMAKQFVKVMEAQQTIQENLQVTTAV